VAAEAGHTTLFQRSVNYVGPKADREFKEWETWAFTHVPGVYRLYRWSIYARFESRFVLFRSGKRRLGKRFAALFAKGLREGVVPHGIEERLVVPPDPVGCRRILISGDWYPTLLRPDVTVTDAPIEAITPTGIRTGDGVEHPADVIVYGTGFEATGFVSPVVVSGVDGVKLADAWADGAEAYLGLTVAGFPNFFLLYGPNTNLGHNSILVMVERQVEYVIRCLGELTRRGARAMDVAPAAYAANVSDVQDRVRGTVWAESCHSWYKTATGKVTQNWPGFTVTYWRDTLRPRFRDYRFQGRR
jgi:cation diffusion facilitator CzcD-associated flavoprotein CzcO